MAQSNKPCQRCKPALIGKSLAECGRTMWSGKRVAVVIPAFNEAERIGATLRRLPDWIDEAIVVNDGSSDDTADRAYRVGDERVRVVTHGRNQGVGAAIRTGYKEAIGSCAAITVVMAADNQMDPTDLPALLAPVLHGQADYAKGNRFLHAAHKDMPPLRRLGSRFLSWLTRVTTGLAVDDCQCGFTAIDRDTLLRLPLDDLWGGYGYPNDLLALLALQSARVVDVPVRPIYAGEASGLHAGHVAAIATRIIRRRLRRRFAPSAPARAPS